jgi:hypothetical protein
LATFAALFAHLAGERQLKIGTQGGAEQRTVERERSFRGGPKGFYQTKWDRVSNISENPNTADGSEWRAGEWVQGHWL